MRLPASRGPTCPVESAPLAAVWRADRTLAKRAVADALEAYWGADREQAELLAALSDGRLGYAVSLLEDRESLNRRRRALEEMSLLAGAPITERVNVATKLAKMFTD